MANVGKNSGRPPHRTPPPVLGVVATNGAMPDDYITVHDVKQEVSTQEGCNGGVAANPPPAADFGWPLPEQSLPGASRAHPAQVDIKPRLEPDPHISSTSTSTSRSHSPPCRFKSEGPKSGSSTPAQGDRALSPKAARGGKKGKGKAVKAEVQYIRELRECSKEAESTFVVLEENWYQNKSIGRTKQQEEAMVCDCSWKIGDPPSMACSEESGCINYLTQVECLASECRCHSACLNQRFQRRQYAAVEIVETERKGYGMRCKETIPADTFVYEYIGEVVGEKAFQRRMKEYTNEGLRHFYFMQLQREEFIDATKKGGLGRFLNHSCNPNCYIAKWVVGRQMRMGIFTKRVVCKDEELTFNYNVDRYGHEAQECYCGELNCVGFLGGKTQTDVGAMDDLYLDALGIADDVESLALKGNKTKKGRKMDIDYIPVMKPIVFKDVPKVASAIRQSCQTRRILTKLMRRIQITEDVTVQRQLMRLHGFSLMSMVLNEYPDDEEVIQIILEVLLKWPLITKNKLVSTNIEETVVKLSEKASPSIQCLATELLRMWVDLEVSYRIPKAKLQEGDAATKRPSFADFDDNAAKRARLEDPQPVLKLHDFVRPEPAKPVSMLELKPEEIILPHGWVFARDEHDLPYWSHPFTKHRQWQPPSPADALRVQRQADIINEAVRARAKAAASDVNDIVARAQAEADAAAAAAKALADAERAEKERRKAEKAARRERAKQRAEAKKRKKEQEANSKDKKILRLFSEVVVRTMSRYKGALDHEQFKKRAKEVTDILCQKEKRSRHYESESYDTLTPEKEAKIKAFVKEWTAKLLARKGISASTSASASSASTTTPPTQRLPSASSCPHSKPPSTYVDLPTPQTPATGATTPTTASPQAPRQVQPTTHLPNVKTLNDQLLAEINGDDDGGELLEDISDDEDDDDEGIDGESLTLRDSAKSSTPASAAPTLSAEPVAMELEV